MHDETLFFCVSLISRKSGSEEEYPVSKKDIIIDIDTQHNEEE